jgi:hypothetical protein
MHAAGFSLSICYPSLRGALIILREEKGENPSVELSNLVIGKIGRYKVMLTW